MLELVECLVPSRRNWAYNQADVGEGHLAHLMAKATVGYYSSAALDEPMLADFSCPWRRKK